MNKRTFSILSVRKIWLFLLVIGLCADSIYGHSDLNGFGSTGSEAALHLEPALEDERTLDFQVNFDLQDLESYIDGLMASLQTAHNIAGATVAIVHNGEVLLSKGYGWADKDQRKPVDGVTTLFRIGSVSKLFTATAIMQLRDQGSLDLDTDITEYIDISIPQTYDEPITLRHLLTHTAGFEDRIFGVFAPLNGENRGDLLQANMPARINPPGSYISYSNFGITLAGYIAEEVSGMSWEDYIQQYILGPLGMEYATGFQPVPGNLEAYLSNGYSFQQGRFVRQTFENIGIHAPAGGVSASAESMSRFMIAMLNDGEFNGNRILQSESAAEMRERAFLIDERVNNMALGFYEQSSHGLRMVGHGGSTTWFHTDLSLIPEMNMGIFVSFNTDRGAIPAIGVFRRMILDRYFSTEESMFNSPAPGWDDRAAAYQGSYVMLRRSFTTFEKALGMIFGRITIEIADDGEIILNWPLGQERMREIEPGHFRKVDGQLEVAFIGDPATGYSQISVSDLPTMAATRPGPADSAALHLSLLSVSLILFLSLPVLMVRRYLLQRRFDEIQALRGPERWSRWLGFGYVLLALLFIIQFVSAIGDMESFMAGEGASAIRAALIIPLIMVPWALLLVAAAGKAFRQRWWSRRSRIHFMLFAVATLVFVIQLFHWNLMGWWNV
jgi:CubicO group peptidase (beta-lactamase class C family)